MAEKHTAAEMAANIIKVHKPDFAPKIGIILGSGLGVFVDKIEHATVIPYYKLPNFPPCTVKGHGGNLILGDLHNVPIACLEGRAHLYEGVSPLIIKNVIRTLKLLGCELVILTNAAGSLRVEVGVGSLMLVTDHINFQFTNVLLGPNDDEFGERFVAMQQAYDPEIREEFLAVAKRLDIDLAQGVYLAISGPTFETPAEIKAFKLLGVDAVGMSVVPETIVARHCGLKVAAISAITNLAAGMRDEVSSHEQTLAGAKLAAGKMVNLLVEFVRGFKGS